MTDTKKLRAIIVERGMTQSELAEKLDISLSAFNFKVNNKRPFNSDEMFKLCEILHIEDPKPIFFANQGDLKSLLKRP